MVLLLYYAHTYRLDASRTGLVRLCIYVLQTISADSVFSVRLNRQFDSHNALPSSMQISGWEPAASYADYLLITTYSLMSSSNGKLAALYPSLLDTQMNLAPHLSNISRLTCSRLMQLFSTLSAPSFLVANSTNYMLVDKLLEAMTDMIVNNNHQSNANLLYTIFRSRKKFEALKELTFGRCLEEVRMHRRVAATTTAGDGDHKGDVAVSIGGDSTTAAETVRDHKGKGKDSPDGAGSSASTFSNANSGLQQSDTDWIFTPTQHWFDSWHSKLHLEIICHLLDVLPEYIPRLSTIHKAPGSSSAATSPTRGIREYPPDSDVISALRHLDDESILPDSYQRSFREPIAFEWTVAAKGWYYSVLWGAIYVMHEFIASEDGSGAGGIVAAVTGSTGASAGTAWCGVWRGTKIQLFKVQESKATGPSLLRPRGAVDAVAKSMLERLHVVK